MNTLEPTYVTFEQAKWLKEKGYKSKSRYYDGSGKLVIVPNISGNDYRHTNNYMQRFRWEAPEQWQVVEWLRLNHGIWISVFYKRHSENKHYGFNIRQANGIETVLWEFESPQEACSAAFDYINENNLI